MTVDVLARHRVIVGPFAHEQNGKLGLRHVGVRVSRPDAHSMAEELPGLLVEGRRRPSDWPRTGWWAPLARLTARGLAALLAPGETTAALVENTLWPSAPGARAVQPSVG